MIQKRPFGHLAIYWANLASFSWAPIFITRATWESTKVSRAISKLAIMLATNLSFGAAASQAFLSFLISDCSLTSAAPLTFSHSFTVDILFSVISSLSWSQGRCWMKNFFLFVLLFLGLYQEMCWTL